MGGSMVGTNGGYSPKNTYDRIKELLEKNGYDVSSDEKMGEVLKTSKSSVQRWKNNFPRVDDLIFISQKFGVSLDWLVFGKEENKKDSPAEPAEKPIEEYTVKDICKAFLALSHIANIEIIENENSSSRIDLFGTIQITPKKATCLESVFKERAARLAITAVDKRELYIAEFVHNVAQQKEFWRHAALFVDESDAIKDSIYNLLNSQQNTPILTYNVDEIRNFDFSQFSDDWYCRRGKDYSYKILDDPEMNYIIQNREIALSQRLESENIYESSGEEWFPSIRD